MQYWLNFAGTKYCFICPSLYIQNVSSVPCSVYCSSLYMRNVSPLQMKPRLWTVLNLRGVCLSSFVKVGDDANPCQLRCLLRPCLLRRYQGLLTWRPMRVMIHHLKMEVTTLILTVYHWWKASLTHNTHCGWERKIDTGWHALFVGCTRGSTI